jgi:hypothetical protein
VFEFTLASIKAENGAESQLLTVCLQYLGSTEVMSKISASYSIFEFAAQEFLNAVDRQYPNTMPDLVQMTLRDEDGAEAELLLTRDFEGEFLAEKVLGWRDL